MGKNLGDGDPYMETMPDLPVKELPSRLPLMARATKDLEAEQLDYDSILNGERTGHPSMRDQEYLEHSSLFGKLVNLFFLNCISCVFEHMFAKQILFIQSWNLNWNEKTKQVISVLRAAKVKLDSIFSR